MTRKIVTILQHKSIKQHTHTHTHTHSCLQYSALESLLRDSIRCTFSLKLMFLEGAPYVSVVFSSSSLGNRKVCDGIKVSESEK